MKHLLRLYSEKWVTNSSIQDWYGLISLMSGSLLVALVAMFFAVPLGVGAAIYVNPIGDSGARSH